MLRTVLFPCYLSVLCFIKYALGLSVNQTIEDLDPFILYQPPEKWHTYNDPSCSGGTYTIGHDSCVNATIQCSWISFYYVSPLWPYAISTEISIDGGEPTVVDLQDHIVSSDNNVASPSAGSRVVFSYLGTESQLHTILISGSAANPYSVVDSLIFETTDGSGCDGGYRYHGGSTYTYSYNYGSTLTDTVTATTTTTITTKVDAPFTEFSTTVSTKTIGTATTTTTTTAFGATKSADTNIVTYYRHKNHGLNIGIAILAVIVGCLLLCLCYLLWHHRRHRHYIPPSQKPAYGSGGGTNYGGGGGAGEGTSATGYGVRGEGGEATGA